MDALVDEAVGKFLRVQALLSQSEIERDGGGSFPFG